MPELGADLLAEVLFLTHQIRKHRITRCCPGAGGDERLLNRAATDKLGETKGLQRGIAGADAGKRPYVGFNHGLRTLGARGGIPGIIGVGAGLRAPHRRHQDRNSDLEFAQRVVIAPGERQADRQSAVRKSGFHVLLAETRLLPRQQPVRRLDARAQVVGIV